jgi:hypothetical protein
MTLKQKLIYRRGHIFKIEDISPIVFMRSEAFEFYELILFTFYILFSLLKNLKFIPFNLLNYLSILAENMKKNVL